MHLLSMMLQKLQRIRSLQFSLHLPALASAGFVDKPSTTLRRSSVLGMSSSAADRYRMYKQKPAHDADGKKIPSIAGCLRTDVHTACLNNKRE